MHPPPSPPSVHTPICTPQACSQTCHMCTTYMLTHKHTTNVHTPICTPHACTTMCSPMCTPHACTRPYAHHMHSHPYAHTHPLIITNACPPACSHPHVPGPRLRQTLPSEWACPRGRRSARAGCANHLPAHQRGGGGRGRCVLSSTPPEPTLTHTYPSHSFVRALSWPQGH